MPPKQRLPPAAEPDPTTIWMPNCTKTQTPRTQTMSASRNPTVKVQSPAHLHMLVYAHTGSNHELLKTCLRPARTRQHPAVGVPKARMCDKIASSLTGPAALAQLSV